MNRKNRLKSTEPEDCYKAVTEALERFPKDAARCSNITDTRTAIYELESSSKELDIRHDVLRSHMGLITQIIFTGALGFSTGAAAIFIPLSNLLKHYLRFLLLLAGEYVFFMGSVAIIFYLDSRTTATEIHKLGNMRRTVQQHLNAYRLRFDELQDQTSPSAPGASQRFFRRR